MIGSEYRVLVCGGRRYNMPVYVDRALEMIWAHSDGVLVVIEGGATGADQWAGEWAGHHEAFGVKHEPYPAKWRENGYYNPSAGFERNSRMLTEGKPDLCVFFPGGNGTHDMVKKCRDAGVPVVAGEVVDEVREAIRINHV